MTNYIKPCASCERPLNTLKQSYVYHPGSKRYKHLLCFMRTMTSMVQDAVGEIIDYEMMAWAIKRKEDSRVLFLDE